MQSAIGLPLIIIQVDECLQDGQLRFDEKFIGIQNECCYVVLYFPGFTGMVGTYVLISFY